MLKPIVMMLALTAMPALAQEPSAPRLEAVDAAITPTLEAGQFPGVAIAVLDQGAPVHVSVHGLASLEHAAPVRTDTVFELASLTKHMTALMVLTLADEGRVSLDDPVSLYETETPETWSAITIDQLLSHMAGLTHRFEARSNGQFQIAYSTEEMLASAMATPLQAEPGTDWSYSDQGYFLLGLVIEAVTGQSFEDALRERFWAPLGMDQTRMLDQSAIVRHRAEGYGVYDGELARNRRVWQFGLTSHFGVTSSLEDMMIWEAELDDPQILNPQVIAQAAEIQRAFDVGETCERWGYARGWWSYEIDGRQITSHAGYAGTAYVRDMTSGQSVIVLTNREDGEGLISPLAIAWAAAHAAGMDVPEAGLTCWR
jgi:CubicO group peptidase (beta-lactamase class C family)